MTDQESYQAMIRAECEKRKLPDFRVVCAIIEHESSWNPWAIKFEPRTRDPIFPINYAKINHITADTERTLQQYSFGLGQIMGYKARELGYQRLLTELCDPHTAIYWTCELYAKLDAKYKTIEEKIAAYNEGSVRLNDEKKFLNQDYVDSVLKLYRSKNYG